MVVDVVVVGIRLVISSEISVAVGEVAAGTLETASGGLGRRSRLDSSGSDETGFLGALYEIVESGHCPAEEKLEKFHGEWGGKIDHLFKEYAY